MKSIKITLLALILSLGYSVAIAQNQGVAINMDGSQADASALLDVKSTTGGVLVPRMDMAARDAIAGGNPATGLLVYQTDNTPGFYYYDGAAWQAIGGASGPDGDWTVNGNDLYNNNTGNTGIGTSTPGATLEVAGHIWQTGTGNSIFLGEQAGENDNLNDNINVFIGRQTGQSNTSGSNNIGLGSQALNANSTGSRNIGIGSLALPVSTGNNNISIGHSTSFANSSGTANTIIGTWAYKLFTTASDNTVVGFSALADLDVFHITNYTGDRLTAVGSNSLYKNQSGSRNTGVGYKALYDNKNGGNNTALGYGAGQTLDGLNNTTSIGSGAVATSSNQIMLGNSSVNQVKTSGGITVGNTTVTDPGTIRFQGGHFEGWNGSAWVQLD